MLFPVCKLCLNPRPQGPAATVNAIELTADDQPLRIGYDRISDDSVSSSVWTESQGRSKFVRELIDDPDIRAAWVRCIPTKKHTLGVAHYFKEPVA